MTDYCGAIVKLKQTLHTRGGETFEKGTTMICTTTWRGMLNLALRDNTLGGHGPVAIQQVHRGDVDILTVRLA